MQIIKSIVSLKDELENSIKQLSLLGPFFLILTASISPFKMVVLISLGLFLIFRLKLKGLLLSLMLLVSFASYTHLFIDDKQLFNALLETSVLLGFFITYLSLEEINRHILSYVEKHSEESETLKLKLSSKEKNFENHQSLLKENYDKLEFDLKQNSSNLEKILNENANFRSMIEEHINKKDILLNELDQKEKDVIEKETKIDELFEKISFLKDEEFLAEENQKLKKEIEKLSLSIPYSDVDNLKEELRVLKNVNQDLIDKLTKIEPNKEAETFVEDLSNSSDLKSISSLYTQLKEQFEDKSILLHKTRKDLFYAQEMLSAMKKEKDNDFNDFNDIEKGFEKDIQKLTQDLKNIETENQILEEIVKKLSSKNSVKAEEQKFPF